MVTIQGLKNDIEKIKERNKRVEEDKSWETSTERKLLIAVLTYFCMVIFFFFAGLPRPFINSIVPALAFWLSTMTLPIAKKVWLQGKRE